MHFHFGVYLRELNLPHFALHSKPTQTPSQQSHVQTRSARCHPPLPTLSSFGIPLQPLRHGRFVPSLGFFHFPLPRKELSPRILRDLLPSPSGLFWPSFLKWVSWSPICFLSWLYFTAVLKSTLYCVFICFLHFSYLNWRLMKSMSCTSQEQYLTSNNHSRNIFEWVDEWINEWVHEWPTTDHTHSYRIVEIRMYIYFVLSLNLCIQ